MKKLILLSFIVLLLFGCGGEKVEDIDGVFRYGINTKMFIEDEETECDFYYETIVFVEEGYVQKVQNMDYYTYEIIEDYFDMKPENFLIEQQDIYQNATSETGFAILEPKDNGEAIVVIYESDYSDLNLVEYDYLPLAALNKKGDKIIFQKYIENQQLIGNEIE